MTDKSAGVIELGVLSFGMAVCVDNLASLELFVITAQKMKFSIKDFFSKCKQSRKILGICSHLPKKSQIENFTFCVVDVARQLQHKVFYTRYYVLC